jgi:hypothetical protein
MTLDPLPRFRRRPNAPDDTETDKESSSTSGAGDNTGLKRATKTRRNAIVVLSIFYMVAIIFLILVRGWLFLDPLLHRAKRWHAHRSRWEAHETAAL